MSSPTLDKHLGNPSWQRPGKRILARWFFESLVGVSTGALVGMLVKTLHRALGHPVISGTYSFRGFENVGVMEHTREGLLVGLVAGAVISIGYGLAGGPGTPMFVRRGWRRGVGIVGRQKGRTSPPRMKHLSLFQSNPIALVSPPRAKRRARR
jgi:hypothetical protein